MNEQSPHTAGSARTLGKRPSELSQQRRTNAVRELDELLELRDRIAACLDEIDAGDPLIAAANLEFLLRDLDGAAA